jgi:hypothetical protein
MSSTAEIKNSPKKILTFQKHERQNTAINADKMLFQQKYYTK